MAIRISGATGIDMGNTPVSNVNVGVLDYNAATKQYVDDSAVNLTGNQTIAGVKTFSSNIVGNIAGNADTATTLATARTINGVAFDGTANIIVPVSDDSAVNLTKNQTIGGIKTFSSDIVGNITGNSATATKLATARTINGVEFDGSANITVVDSTAVNLTGNQTIAGVKTFSSSPIVPTPTTATQAANKAYVDSASVASGAAWSANDARAKTALNASGAAPIYACRAWVNFNGNGTVAIRASGNVSSITDNGTGDYTVNFTTAMPDANYTVSGAIGDGTSMSSSLSMILGINTIFSANYIRFKTVFVNTQQNILKDMMYVSCIIHR